MPLLARTVATPLTIEIRPAAIRNLPTILADGRITSSGRVAVAVGPGLGAEVSEVISRVFPESELFQVQGGSLDSAQELREFLRKHPAEAMVGIGGGGTIDVGKYAASMAGIPFVAVATNLTHDGIASPVATLQSAGHKGSYGVHIPIAVIVDLDFVARSPIAHTRSGIGDAVSNLSAVNDWFLANRTVGEPVDGLAAAMAKNAAEAVLHQPHPTDSETFLATLADSLVMSGLAMAIAGSSRPCSGGCHEISHAIDQLFGLDRLHGEQVAVGAMFASFLREDPDLVHVDACFRRHELPRLPADLGLTAEQFTEAVLAAPSTRPGRYTILEQLDMDRTTARRQVDAFVAAFDG